MFLFVSVCKCVVYASHFNVLIYIAPSMVSVPWLTLTELPQVSHVLMETSFKVLKNLTNQFYFVQTIWLINADKIQVCW